MTRGLSIRFYIRKTNTGGGAEQNRRARVSGAERDDGQACWPD